MRKIWLSVLFLLIFLLSCNLFSTQSYATEGDLSASPSSQTVNYELPYPGLLPDSPLYFLRIIRDRTVGFLISDSLKKSEFNLLQADKRLNAAIYLVNKGNVSLAFTTVSKAENYFLEALDKMDEAKKQGRDIGGIQGNLKSALEKHEQELGFLIEKVSAEFKPSFEKELKRVVSFEQRLSQ